MLRKKTSGAIKFQDEGAPTSWKVWNKRKKSIQKTNKQTKNQEKTQQQQQKNGINEASFTLSDLYFNSWALRTVEDWQETMRRAIGEGITS